MIAQYCKATIECTGEAVSLLLVSSGLATTTGSLELASPGSHEGLDMAAGTTGGAKVLLSLTGLAGSLDQQSSLSSGGPQGQLIKGDDFT